MFLSSSTSNSACSTSAPANFSSLTSCRSSLMPYCHSFSSTKSPSSSSVSNCLSDFPYAALHLFSMATKFSSTS